MGSITQAAPSLLAVRRARALLTRTSRSFSPNVISSMGFSGGEATSSSESRSKLSVAVSVGASLCPLRSLSVGESGFCHRGTIQLDGFKIVIL